MASEPIDQVAFFDAAAPRYERISADCTQDLARFVVAIQPLASMFSPDALVLDNAAGTGFVAEEIARLARATNRPIPRICVADAAPAMISLAERKLAGLGLADLCSTHVMLGEELEFPEGHFTHSITNVGIMFFHDSIAGLREIHRTVKPGGGVAVVTCWEGRGFLDLIREAQLIARPDSQLMNVTFGREWLQPDYLETLMREQTGFANVRLEKHVAIYGMSTREQLQDMMVQRFLPSSRDWSASEQAAFRVALGECIARDGGPFTMLDGQPGFGVPMTGIIVIGERV